MLQMLQPVIQTITGVVPKVLTKYGPSVSSVLKDGQKAMNDGGSLAPLSKKVDDLGGGAYHIGYKLGIYGVLLAIIVAGVLLVFSNAQNRQERKDKIVWIIIGAVMICGGVGLVIFFETIGSGLFA